MKTLAICMFFCASAYSATYYVDVNCTNPIPSYTSWETASTNIQGAVDIASIGDTVLVRSGRYILNSTISVTEDITIKSADGSTNTIVDGGNLYQCFNLGNTSCLISGFTIINGYSSGDGGGVYCSGDNPMIENCSIVSNWASVNGGGLHRGTAVECSFVGNSANGGNHGGGGMYKGTAIDCTFAENWARCTGGGKALGIALRCIFTSNMADGQGPYGGHSGGMWGGVAVECTFDSNVSKKTGGGMAAGVASNCIFIGNSAQLNGGGMIDGTAVNCAFIGNTSSQTGGGLYRGSAQNCLIVSNSANHGGGAAGQFGDRLNAVNCTVIGNTASSYGGGFIDVNPDNCIVWGNTASVAGDEMYRYDANNTCSPAVIHGVDGNITTAPLFVGAGNYRLATNSPCINAGNNTYVLTATDPDGNPRIVDGTVDMGTYESGFNGCLITNSYASGSEVVLEWNTFPMWESRVMYSTNLFTMPFTNFPETLTYPLNCYTDTTHSAASECYYRVKIIPQD